MKRIFFLISLFLTFIILLAAFAQKDCVVKGKILIRDKTPAYVTVALKKQRKITQMDNDGNFKLMNVYANCRVRHEIL